MSQGLMNLTVTGINQTIEDVLDDYPVHPYQSAFSMPELRQKLVAHILSQVPQQLVEGLQLASTSPVCHYSRLQVRLRLEMLVRGSILHILRENAAWLHRNLSKF